MADPIKMAASHVQDNEAAALGPEDYQTILDLIKAKDPRGVKLAQTLKPDEAQAFFDFQKGVNKGINPAASPDRNLATGIPLLGSIDPADVVPVGSMIKAGMRVGGGALSGMANGLENGFSRGIAGGLKGLLNELGFGSGAASGAGLGAEEVISRAKGPTVTAPESDAAYEAATGHARGSFGPKLRTPAGRPGSGLSAGEEAGVQGLDELFQRTGNNSPNPMGHGTFQEAGAGKLGGPDTAGLRSQPNVSLKRSAADVREQVTGSSRSGDNGLLNYQPKSGVTSLSQDVDPYVNDEVSRIQDEIKSKLDAAESTRKSKLRKPK